MAVDLSEHTGKENLVHLYAAESRILDQRYSDACQKTKVTLKTLKKSQLIMKHSHILTGSDFPQPHLSTFSDTTLSSDKAAELQSKERSSVPSTKEIIPVVHTATDGVDSTSGGMHSGVYNGQVRQTTPLWSHDDFTLTKSYNGTGTCIRQASEPYNLSTSSTRFQRICTAWKHVPIILRPGSNNSLSHCESGPVSLETICVERVSSLSCSTSNLCGNSNKLANGMATPSPLSSASLRHISNYLGSCLAAVDSMYCEMTKKLKISQDVVLKKPCWLKSKLTLSFELSVTHNRSQRIRSDSAQTSSSSRTRKCDKTILNIETSQCLSAVETVRSRVGEDLMVTKSEEKLAFACRSNSETMSAAQCHLISSHSQSRNRKRSDRMTRRRGSSASSPIENEVDTECTGIFVNKSACGYQLRKRTPVKDHHSQSQAKSVKKVKNTIFEYNAKLQKESCSAAGSTAAEVAAFSTCVEQKTPLLLPTDSFGLDSKADDDDDIRSVSSDCSGILPCAKRLQFGLNPVLAGPKTRSSPPQKIIKKGKYSSGKLSASIRTAASPRSAGKTKVSAKGRNRTSPCINSRYVSKERKSANLSKKSPSVSSRKSISNKKQLSRFLKKKRPLSDKNVSYNLHQTEPVNIKKMAVKKNKEKRNASKLVNNKTKAQDQTKAIIKKLVASKISAAARNSARNVALTIKGGKKSSKSINETPSALSHFKKKRKSNSSVPLQPKKRRLENGNQKIVKSASELLSRQSAIISHHEHLSTKAASSSILTLSEKDMFSQLCRLEERAKAYDDSVMHSLIPLTEKSKELNIYRKPVERQYSASNAHVGGIWKSIFSER